MKLKISDFVRSHYDVFGVRTYRVFLLWIIVKFTGADIVLSSSWRHGFMDQTKEKAWYSLGFENCIITGKELYSLSEEMRNKLLEIDLEKKGLKKDGD